MKLEAGAISDTLILVSYSVGRERAATTENSLRQ